MMVAVCLAPTASADVILVQSTTSTQNSGLYDVILPLYEAETGDEVRVVAVGTGQAIKNARNCDGDVLIVHSRTDEEAFVADGFGQQRHNLMHNDFVLIGPKLDPAKIKGAVMIEQALQRLAQAEARFISRGDDSGTHKAEMRFWELAGITPSEHPGRWYVETGQGMGGTLNMAVQLDGYTISDRSTWLAFGNRQDHHILFDGDDAMFNQYGIIPVSPDACPEVRYEAAERLTRWLLSPRGQTAINSYTVRGQQLFFANADQQAR